MVRGRQKTMPGVATALACGALLLAAALALAGGAKTSIVSVGLHGANANRGSFDASIASDGRSIAFTSRASNLVEGDTNNRADIFIRDLESGETRRVSVGLNGAEANGRSREPSISADGRRVAFESGASNLVEGDENGTRDIFVRDLEAGTTRLVSVGADGSGAALPSFSPSISSDGRFVAFLNGDRNPRAQVYVRDLERGETELVSIGSDGEAGNLRSWAASISADGTRVAFSSYSTNLVGDADEELDLFVRDLETGSTRQVIRLAPGNLDAFSISANGRAVAFTSHASRLVQGDTNGEADVFVRHLATGRTRRVSVGLHGVEPNGRSRFLSISADERFVAFWSHASNLVEGEHRNDIFVRDLETRETWRVPVGPSKGRANPVIYDASMSANGRFVVFDSRASNLVRGDTDGRRDVFRWGPLQ
jgi:Tol biopolymer transport system component